MGNSTKNDNFIETRGLDTSNLANYDEIDKIVRSDKSRIKNILENSTISKKFKKTLEIKTITINNKKYHGINITNKTKVNFINE